MDLVYAHPAAPSHFDIFDIRNACSSNATAVCSPLDLPLPLALGGCPTLLPSCSGTVAPASVSPASFSPASFSPASHCIPQLARLSRPRLLLCKLAHRLLPAWTPTTDPPLAPPAARAMALSPDAAAAAASQWALVLVLLILCVALLLSIVVVGLAAVHYGSAYAAAPIEAARLIETADAALAETESYDRDVVARVAQRDDKVRLDRMLREIQRASDDLREDLNRVLMPAKTTSATDQPAGTDDSSKGTSTALASEPSLLARRSAPSAKPDLFTLQSHAPPRQLTTSARLLWASRRTHLEERVRRLDMLRMRFLVVHMGIVASTAAAAAEKAEKSAIVVAAAASPAAPVSSAKPTPQTLRTVAKTSLPATPAASHLSSSASSDEYSDDESDCASDSSGCSSPLMSATRSKPTSPEPPRSPRSPRSPRLPRLPKKTAADIVADSLAAAAAAAVASGDTDSRYYPVSPPMSPGQASVAFDDPDVPATPARFGRPHPFLQSITEEQQLRSVPGSPESKEGSSRKPVRRVTALGIRTPEPSPEHSHRAGWMGVVQELQRSPLLQKRHTSIEMSMARQKNL